MNREQDLVADFHEKFGATVGRHPEMRDRELRAKLILEEAVETVAAMGYEAFATMYEGEKSLTEFTASYVRHYDAPDFEDAIDGLVDLLYVIYGAAVAWGVDLEPFFEEVHRANMAKEGGAMREDGKVLKPEGWQPPDIDRILIRQQRMADVWKEIEEQTLALETLEVIA